MGKNNINKEDEMIRNFLVAQKTKVENAGFKQRVLNQLPVKKTNYNFIIHMLNTVGLIIALIYLDITDLITHYTVHLTNDIYNLIKIDLLQFDLFISTISLEEYLYAMIILSVSASIIGIKAGQTYE